MRMLLDTHVLIWALAEPRKLAKGIRAMVEARENEVLFSAASTWEIAIKAQVGRVRFTAQPEELAQAAVASGFDELPVYAVAASRVAQLPMYHRDPFDRILVAQAIAESIRLFTADAMLARYSDLVTVI